MGKTVVGLFKNERVAEEAVRDLRGEGFEKRFPFWQKIEKKAAAKV